MNKKKKIILFSVLAVLLVLLAVTGVFGIKSAKAAKAQAGVLKSDLTAVMSDISSGDMDSARTSLSIMNNDNQALHETITTPLWKVAGFIPVVGKQVKSAVTLTEVLDTASGEILSPLIDLLDEYPVASLLGSEDAAAYDTVDASEDASEDTSVDTSVDTSTNTSSDAQSTSSQADTQNATPTLNTDAINAYVAFADSAVPVMADLSDQMNSINISMVDPDGKITAYIDQFAAFADFLKQASETVVTPLAAQLEAVPLDTLRTEDGYNNAAIRSYLIFIDEMMPKVQALTDSMNEMDFSAIDTDGKIRETVAEVQTLAAFLNKASTTVVEPLIDQLEQYPLDEIKADDGFNVTAINNYLTFIEDLMPACRSLSEDMAALQGGRLDKNGLLTEYKTKLDNLINIYDESEQYLPLLHTILSDGSDRFYFVGTQNSAEIRASGGFPGCVGTLSIKDGIITIGDFKSVYKVFYYRNPVAAGITDQERNLFQNMPYPWDADFCPDFERVGQIWALAYEDKYDVHVDGVISMTPAIIQSLIAFLGDIELSDGTVLTADNATRFLQNEIYVKYQNTYSEDYEGNSFVDGLFAETAKKTMSLLVSQFKVSYMPQFLNVLNEGIADRTIMFWFADEDEEELVRECGASGGLNRDENNPVAGIYFNLANACKMGWYLDIDVEVGGIDIEALNEALNDASVDEGSASTPTYVLNSDGSRTYDVTATFTNIMTYAESQEVSGYITSTGYMSSEIYFFAPAGGTVSDFHTDVASSVHTTTYSGLDLGYLVHTICAGQSVTVTYKVTTAPGVDADLSIVTTPTLTKYRN